MKPRIKIEIRDNERFYTSPVVIVSVKVINNLGDVLYLSQGSEYKDFGKRKTIAHCLSKLKASVESCNVRYNPN